LATSDREARQRTPSVRAGFAWAWRSGWLEDGYRFIDYPHDQQMFLREIVRAPAVLIGHSLGGMNALYIAAETPELVRAIVLEDPPLYFEQGLSVFEPTFRAIKALAESNLPIENLALKVTEVTRAPLEFARTHAEYIVQLDPQTLGQLLDGSAFELWRTDALLTVSPARPAPVWRGRAWARAYRRPSRTRQAAP
jgi:pimeloyl-ACP methyl ester carboxylesterase